MEDNALAVVLDRLGMLDRYIIIRDSVNTDAFMNGASPESLWDPNFVDSLASDESVESADIFATAMENNFKVGKVVIDAITTTNCKLVFKLIKLSPTGAAPVGL